MLYTYEAPPYQFAVRAGPDSVAVAGSTVTTMDCAFRGMDEPVSFSLLPARLAIHRLKSGVGDGYFAVTPTRVLEGSATLSQPVALEKWYYFSQTRQKLDWSDRIGVLAGSSEALWLERSGLTKPVAVADTSQLAALVRTGRIDGVLMDWKTMSFLLQRGTRDDLQSLRQLKGSFVRFATLHAYFNNDFLERRPQFLGRFNTELSRCVSGTFILEEPSQQLLKSASQSMFSELAMAIDLVAASASPHRTDQEIAAIDTRWQAGDKATTEPYTDSANSRLLKQWQSKTQRRVNEVFIVDDQGAITATSHLTSDFWQGDEQKFLDSRKLEPGEIALSALTYDVSTQRFQVYATLALSPVEGDAAGGAVILGLDVEQILDLYALPDAGLNDSPAETASPKSRLAMTPP